MNDSVDDDWDFETLVFRFFNRLSLTCFKIKLYFFKHCYADFRHLQIDVKRLHDLPILLNFLCLRLNLCKAEVCLYDLVVTESIHDVQAEAAISGIHGQSAHIEQSWHVDSF